MRMLPIDDKDFDLLSKWASIGRTLRNVCGLLEDYQTGETLNEGRMQIALDEFPMLINIFERLNDEAKQIRFKEELAKQKI